MNRGILVLLIKRISQLGGTELQEVEEGRRREMDVGLDNLVKLSMHDPDRNLIGNCRWNLKEFWG